MPDTDAPCLCGAPSCSGCGACSDPGCAAQGRPCACADFAVDNLGTVWVVTTLTGAAREWVESNVLIEPLFGDAGHFLGDWRPMRDLVDAMVGEGLVPRRS